MKFKTQLIVLFILMISYKVSAQDNKGFIHTIKEKKKPWTSKGFENNPDNFQFAIVTDRTGGHREGVFAKAMKKLNTMMPEFVMSVGDLIEGSKMKDTVNAQWTHFDSLLKPLDMKFFYLPGNHDISNKVMRDAWMKKFGRAYYHFLYKNVLFLALDSNDGDGDAVFSDEQIAYFKDVINKHKNARWVMVFMHHPVWLYDDLSKFEELEKVLPKDKYTVYAGHFHQYFQTVRNRNNYYVLATTGGGSDMRGVRFGEFDHVSWVTMTDKGPKMLNLRLNGMIEHDVVNEEGYQKKQALIAAADLHSIMTYNKEKTGGKIHLGITNTSNDSIFFDGKIYHNHHLDMANNTLTMAIAPKQTSNVTFDWTLTQKAQKFFGRFDPVEIDFTIGYKKEPLELPFELQGTYTVSKEVESKEITFTEPNVFSDYREVSLTSSIKNALIKYTTDGTMPTQKSKTYTKPLLLTSTTTIKAAFFDKELQSMTEPIVQIYKKIPLLKPLKMFTNTSSGLTYTYYEGNFTDVPNFKQLTPVRSGVAQDLDVEAIAQDRVDHYAIQYKGFIEVPEDGLYTFYTRSDDGSTLHIHHQLVVDNSGSHSTRVRKGYIPLKKGKHPISIEYFEDYLGEELSIYWTLPKSNKKKKVSFSYLSH